MIIDDILKRRKKTVYKSDLMGIECSSNKMVKQLLLNLVEYLPDGMGTLVDLKYEEKTVKDTSEIMNVASRALMRIKDTTDSKQEIDVLREKVVNMAVPCMREENQLLRNMLTIEDIDNVETRTTIQIVLDIIHNEYEHISGASTLTIEISRFEAGIWNGLYDVKSKHTRVIIGSEEVERLLATRNNLYASMLKEWDDNKGNYFKWDKENSMISWIQVFEYRIY